eukprot:5519804-Prymnesium_polylepis.1
MSRQPARQAQAPCLPLCCRSEQLLRAHSTVARLGASRNAARIGTTPHALRHQNRRPTCRLSPCAGPRPIAPHACLDTHAVAYLQVGRRRRLFRRHRRGASAAVAGTGFLDRDFDRDLDRDFDRAVAGNLDRDANFLPTSVVKPLTRNRRLRRNGE